MLKEGDNFHGFRIEKYCGGGAFGQVYFCQDLSGKAVCLKMIPKMMGNDWKRELQGIVNYRKLTTDQPGLLRIYQVEEDEDFIFYAMEAADSIDSSYYIPDTLEWRLAHGGIALDGVFSLVEKLLKAICILHRQGLVHRDIKPANILFVKGEPVLADMGLVSSLSQSRTQLAGTLDYLPPEFRAGGSDGSSPKECQRGDFYALGKILYTLVSGLPSEKFPSIDSSMPLTFQRRVLIHLAFRMCEQNPLVRLSGETALTTEFKTTRRLLCTGGTILGRLMYELHCLSVSGERAVLFVKQPGALLVVFPVALVTLPAIVFGFIRLKQWVMDTAVKHTLMEIQRKNELEEAEKLRKEEEEIEKNTREVNEWTRKMNEDFRKIDEDIRRRNEEQRKMNEEIVRQLNGASQSTISPTSVQRSSEDLSSPATEEK